jgi:putative endopeptidase
VAIVLFYANATLKNFEFSAMQLLSKQVVGMTDVHAPAKEGVNGPVVNIPEFYEAFDVKPGDKMYRPDNLRVSIW